MSSLVFHYSTLKQNSPPPPQHTKYAKRLKLQARVMSTLRISGSAKSTRCLSRQIQWALTTQLFNYFPKPYIASHHKQKHPLVKSANMLLAVILLSLGYHQRGLKLVFLLWLLNTIGLHALSPKAQNARIIVLSHFWAYTKENGIYLIFTVVTKLCELKHQV